MAPALGFVQVGCVGVAAETESAAGAVIIAFNVTEQPFVSYTSIL